MFLGSLKEMNSRQFIATSAAVTPKGSLVRESDPQNGLNSRSPLAVGGGPLAKVKGINSG